MPTGVTTVDQGIRCYMALGFGWTLIRVLTPHPQAGHEYLSFPTLPCRDCVGCPLGNLSENSEGFSRMYPLDRYARYFPFTTPIASSSVKRREYSDMILNYSLLGLVSGTPGSRLPSHALILELPGLQTVAIGVSTIWLSLVPTWLSSHRSTVQA